MFRGERLVPAEKDQGRHRITILIWKSKLSIQLFDLLDGETKVQSDFDLPEQGTLDCDKPCMKISRTNIVVASGIGPT